MKKGLRVESSQQQKINKTYLPLLILISVLENHNSFFL